MAETCDFPARVPPRHSPDLRMVQLLGVVHAAGVSLCCLPAAGAGRRRFPLAEEVPRGEASGGGGRKSGGGAG